MPLSDFLPGPFGLVNRKQEAQVNGWPAELARERQQDRDAAVNEICAASNCLSKYLLLPNGNGRFDCVCGLNNFTEYGDHWPFHHQCCPVKRVHDAIEGVRKAGPVPPEKP